MGKKKEETIPKGVIPKESKKITLYPLSFDDALKKLLEVKPESAKKKTRVKTKPSSK